MGPFETLRQLINRSYIIKVPIQLMKSSSIKKYPLSSKKYLTAELYIIKIHSWSGSIDLYMGLYGAIRIVPE